MPNRDYPSSYRDREPSQVRSLPQRRRSQGYSQADFDRAQSAYAPEWRSYAQDWRDTPPSSAWTRAEGYAQQRTEQGHRHESVFGDQDWGREGSMGARFAPVHPEHDEETIGQQLRHAGHVVVNRVKRVFRGPKGYKRSDERILEDVNERLAHQDQIDPSDILVSVEAGEVTLAGSVQSRWDKFAAEEIADDVSGVEEVHNRLHVRREREAREASDHTSVLGASHSPLGNTNIRA